MLLTNSPTYNKLKKPLKPVQIDPPQLLPISSLFLNENTPINKEKLIFCYRAVIQALQACLEKDYTKFDAQTTTNCCHGISLLVHNTIQAISKINVKKILSELEKKLEELEKVYSSDFNFTPFLNYLLPESFLTLGQIYILFVIREFDKNRGNWRTVKQKLKKISPVGTKFCDELVKKLQFHFSNLVAESYRKLLMVIPDNFIINDIPITLWGKYIQDEYVKTDKYGRKYAACLYSMQVTLAYLIKQQAKIAFICDLKDSEGIFKDRYVQLFEGDGLSNFKLLEVDELSLAEQNIDEPVIIFGGCAHSDYLDKKFLEFQITPWLYRFPSLVLACDVFYPQFPLIRDDSGFDSNPINPQEVKLKQIIETHKAVNGVSACDPSLFCLTHIYVASLKQIQQTKIWNDQNYLPQSIIPKIGDIS